MAKKSGEAMRTVQVRPLPLPKSRKIQSFARPADGPHRNPPPAMSPTPSNAEAAKAVRIASDHNGKIDPRQMRNS